MVPDIDRIEGGLLGIAVGDALGWPMEDRGNRVGGTASVEPDWNLHPWRRREGGRYRPHEQHVEAGSVSDDTQLTLAVARSVLQGDEWLDYLTRVELPLWTVYERGGGGATKRAAQAWLRGRAPWDEAEKQKAVEQYFEAGGNGAAMRCLAHCVVEPNWEDLASRLDRDAVTTHGHPRALLGSRIYGWAALYGLRRQSGLAYGELLDQVIAGQPEWSKPPALAADWHQTAQRLTGDYEGEWQRTVEELQEALEIARDGITEGAVAVDRPVLERFGAFGEASGAGTVSAVTAIFLATRYVSQPQQGLMSAAFARGADTDTLAAMTGGLLGLLSGTQWLEPLAARVQDHRYTRGLAGELQRQDRHDAVDWQFDTRERTRLYRWLDESTAETVGELPPFGRLRVTRVDDFDSRETFVRAWHLETELGQSLQIKRYDKGRDGNARWVPTAPDQAGAEDRTESPAPPRIGLVLRVADMKLSQAFFTEVVGLTVQRVTEKFVSFGWLALEPYGAGGQLSLGSDHHLAPTIRLYVGTDEVERIRRRFVDFGIEVSPLDGPSHEGFRSRDPDGHPIEVLTRPGPSRP